MGEDPDGGLRVRRRDEAPIAWVLRDSHESEIN